MRDIVIRNCSLIVSGRLGDSVVANSDSLRIVEGTVVEIGTGLRGDSHVLTIDAQGGIVVPGLIDSHSHPVIGGFTPRQNVVGWTNRALHGGVTGVVSAGETHWPGRSRDGDEAAAICASAFLSSRARSSGETRVHGGALLLDKGITNGHLNWLHKLGVRKLGEIGLGSEKDWSVVAGLVGHAKTLGWAAPLHFGGASVPGSSVVGFDLVEQIRPNIISHANGGPTARPYAEIERCISETDAAIEVVFAGNMLAAVKICEMLAERSELFRLQLGTDTPSGTGVIPIAMLRLLTEMVARAGLAPAEAICAATGSVARRYGLDRKGELGVGSDADLCVISAPAGCGAEDAFRSMRAGNTPAISAVIVEGVLELVESRVTPPPERPCHVT